MIIVRVQISMSASLFLISDTMLSSYKYMSQLSSAYLYNLF